MGLTKRQTRILGILGFVSLVIVTPLSTVYALDFQLVEKREPLGNPAVVSYQELDGHQRRAIDRTIADDGPWYRSRAEVPFTRMPIVVRKGDDVHTIGLSEGYNWEAWYGKLPIGTALAGLAGIGVTLRKRIRNRGAVPVRT